MGPFRRLACCTALWTLAACATPEKVERPRPPSIQGEQQAIGRIFDIDVRGGEGATIRLRGVTGRVTVVCILGDEAGGTSGRATDTATTAATESDAAVERGEASTPAGRPEPGAAPGSGDTTGSGVAPGSGGTTGSGATTGSTDATGSTDDTASADAAPAATADLATACADLADRWKDRITVVGLALETSRNLSEIPFRTYRDTGGKALDKSLNLDPVSQILLVDVQGRIARWFPPGRDEALEGEIKRLAF